MYHFKEYIHGIIAKIIRRHSIQGSFLEVGCGQGENLVFLARQGFSGLGVDFSESALAQARKLLDSSGLKNIETRKQDLHEIQGTFDFILAMDVIEHIQDDKTALSGIRKLLRGPNSHLIVGVPSGPYMADDLAFGHFRRYSRENLIRAMEAGGFEVKECLAVGYPFLYFARLLANRFAELPANTLSSVELESNTLKSDIEHPLKNSLFGRALDAALNFYVIRKLIHAALSTQALFSRSTKAHSLIAIARPKPYFPFSKKG